MEKKFELKKKNKNCLKKLEEINEMVKNQQAICEEEKKELREEPKVEPPSQPEEQEEPHEGRKLFATKYGEKNHFARARKGFNGYPRFQKKHATCAKKELEKY